MSRLLWVAGAGGLLAAPLVLPPFYLLFASELLVWSLFALGFNLLYGYAGLLSLGQSVYFGLGAYGVALAILYGGVGLPLALLAGVGAAALGAAVLGALAVRTHGHGFIILTAVTAMALYLLALNLNAITGGDNGRTFTLPAPFGLDLTDRTTLYFALLGTTAAALAGLRWLLRTPLGLSWRLVRENERRAAELGYPVAALKWTAFLASGVLSGLAGALFATFNRFVDASLFHWILSADVIVWTLFGGAGTLAGPVLGTAGFKGLELLLSRWWSTGHPLLLGVALILVVRFFPGGLLGRRRRPDAAHGRGAAPREPDRDQPRR